MTTNVDELNGILLDAWVAKALNYQVLGMALIYYCPESGNPQIVSNQRYSDGALKTYPHYVYINECDCKFLAEFDDEYCQTITGYQKEPYILGHHWQCLKPVPEYSSQEYVGLNIITKNRIGLTPLDNSDQWIAKKDNFTAVGDTLLEAGMKCFVKIVLGETINEPLICM